MSCQSTVYRPNIVKNKLNAKKLEKLSSMKVLIQRLHNCLAYSHTFLENFTMVICWSFRSCKFQNNVLMIKGGAKS